jgi:FlaA1/EpsC-like NDP-sugar epimerase
MLAAAQDGSPEFFTRTTTPRRIPAAGLVASIDVLIVLVAFVAMFIGINLDSMPDGLDGFLALRITVKNVLVVSLFLAAIAFVFHGVGLYNASVRRRGDVVRRLLVATIAVTVMAAMVPLAGHSDTPIDRLSLLLFALVTFTALCTAHGLRARLTHDVPRRRVIIVGTGPRALSIYRALSADRLTPYRVLGFVDSPTAGHVANSFIGRRMLGDLEGLETLLVGEHVDEVYIGLPVKSQYGQIQ